MLDKSNTKFSRICLSWNKLTQCRPLIHKEGGMIQVDIGGHPPIPFGPPPSILSVFHFQHNLLFLAGFWVLNFQSHLEALMIQVDIGGHPPIPFEPPPSVLSVFQFRHNLLFLAVFRALNFQSHFEALHNFFWEN